MKKSRVIRILFYAVLITMALNTAITAQSKKSEKIKTTLLELFEYCANDNYSSASKYLVYIGEDSIRRWADVYDYSNESDKKEVESLCKEIKSILVSGGEFEFTEFTSKKESEGMWNIWLVEFQKGSKKKAYFAFLKIKGNYALGDID
jgi:hypothetical protein